MDDTSRRELLELLGENLRTLTALDQSLNSLMRSCARTGTVDTARVLEAVEETFRVGLRTRSLVRQATEKLVAIERVLAREEQGKADTVRPPDEP